MKTLTTLTAAVALIAGMSIANAAGSTSKPTEVIGTNNNCTKAKTGELICNYTSPSACKAGTKGADCVANPQITSS